MFSTIINSMKIYYFLIIRGSIVRNQWDVEGRGCTRNRETTLWCTDASVGTFGPKFSIQIVAGTVIIKRSQM